MSKFYARPPKGWLVILPGIAGAYPPEKIRLPRDASDMELDIALSKAAAERGEVRYYFKDLDFNSLPIQAQAILTSSPKGTIQEFHGHDGTCLEITCVVKGSLLAVQNDSLTEVELGRMVNTMETRFLGDVLRPGTMHIADPVARHTLVVLEDSVFWTWQLPVPREGDPVFKTARIAM